MAFPNTVIDGGGGLDGDTTGLNTTPVTVIAGAGVETAAAYGISEALLNDPRYGAELKAVFDLFKSGQTGAALEALFKTNYYKNLSPTVKARLKLKNEQRGVYDDTLAKYIETQRRRLVQKGIRIDGATLNSILTTGFDGGFDDNQIDAAIMASGKVGQIGGETIGNVNQLQAYARAYGVSNLYNQAFWDKTSQDLFAGNTTEEDIQNAIRNLSASTYPAFAQGILSGQSMEVQGSYVTQTLSSVLERQITLDTPEAKKFLQWIDPTTGKPGLAPQWYVEKEAKKLPGWDLTDNARNSIDSLSLRVLRDMGLA
jgi:hypothetical protein